jgi:hypothetical protein
MKRSGLLLDMDATSLAALADSFEASEEQFQAALRSTYGKMGRWLRAKSIKGLSSELKIQQKILRARVKAFRLHGGISSASEGAKVWYGLKSIPLARLNPVETPRGVRASGGRFVEGAFIANYGGQRQVLKRRGKGRLPLEIQVADIAEPSTVYIEDQLIGTAEFDRRFFSFLEHELKWRTQTLK